MRPDARRTDLLPSRGDVALAVGLLVVAVLSGRYLDSARPDTVAPSAWWQWLLICTPATLVAFRRLDPVAIVAIATVAQTTIWITNLPEVLLPVIVVLYTATSEAGQRGLRAAILATVVLTAITGVGVSLADDVSVYQLPLVALTCGTAIVLGVNATRQRAVAGELAAATAEVKLRAQHDRAQAVADERAHIGRELHDIIGHSLTVIAVRAESADRVAAHNPTAARNAVTDIAAAAREALTDTRRILVGLQRSSAAELSPPPDLEATLQLVRDFAATGVGIELEHVGSDQHAPTSVVAGGAHRIVQESLTNAIKHGGSDVSIGVSIRCTPDGVDIAVTNTTTGSFAHRSAGIGSGLAGMAERAEVLGGTFTAGREGNAAFVVRAWLPNRETPARP